MKKTALLILGGCIIGFVVLYLIEKLNGNPSGFSWLNGNKTTPPTLAPKAYPRVKNHVLLYQGNNLNVEEIELLQRFINAAGISVPVTGIYDDITEAAVKSITGKGTTSLEEFRYTYMQTMGLKEVSDKIVRGEL